MTHILEYVAMAHERIQKIEYNNRTPHMDLVEDFVYDLEHNHLHFNTDEDVLSYLDNAIHDDAVRSAFKDFKRNYKSWCRRHSDK